MSPLIHTPPRPKPEENLAQNLRRAADHWATEREHARSQVDWEDWREKAQRIRANAVRKLPELLGQLEQRLTANGCQVHRAQDADTARNTVVSICTKHSARLVVKGKSMTSEEIGLNTALEAVGIEAAESDLGEYIVQLLGDRPSHILAPAVHLNADEIAELFSSISGDRFSSQEPEELVAFARSALRERFLQADVGITGANFAIAETGTLVLVESEGNIRLSTSLPRVHIAVMGIEKVLESVADAAHMIQMLPLAAQGQRAAGATSLISGPARNGDDGPQEVHVVLLDNGRSKLRSGDFEEILHCIRCGACLYACPVYGQIGGHAYGSTYAGPIGAVLTPLLTQLNDGSGELSELSTLCGACNEACPVKIPLDRYLIELRALAHHKDREISEQLAFEAWSRLWTKPFSYRATVATAGKVLEPLMHRLGRLDGKWLTKVPFPFGSWTDTKDAPKPATKPFHRRWHEIRG